MISNYFFIPANKEKFIMKSESLNNIDNRIFDFEDSIFEKDVEASINLLQKLKKRNSDWVRIPFESENTKMILEKTTKLGFNNFVVPKFKGIKEFLIIANCILDYCQQPKLILLIENSKSLIDLEDILKKYGDLIIGFGLGSHDFSFESGIDNDLDYLRSIRVSLKVLANAYEKEAIDVVSMNINNKEEFKKDVTESFKCGYRAKLIIHPLQLEILNSFPYYSYEDVKKNQEILSYYKSNVKDREALFTYEGKLYEKMHIKQFEKIVEWGNEFYETNR